MFATPDEIDQAKALGSDIVQCELSNLSFDHVNVPLNQQEIVWRRSAVVIPNTQPCSWEDQTVHLGFIERPKLSKNSESSANNQTQTPTCHSFETSSSVGAVPCKPVLVMRTHFLSELPIDLLLATVQQILNNMDDLSSHFHSESCSWTGLFLRGSAQARLQINIYCHENDKFIVEATRLSGDAEGFRSVFKQLKLSMFHGDEEHQPTKLQSLSESFAAFPSPLLECEMLSDSESCELLQPLVRMVRSVTMESKVKAAKIMCDLSQNEGMQHALCESGCLQALVELTEASAPKDARQHAFLALAHLSVSLSCQEALIDAGILPAIMSISDDKVSDESFDCQEIKREGARMFANVCTRFSSKVIATVGHRAVSAWLECVDKIADERLKLHAGRARDALSLALSA